MMAVNSVLANPASLLIASYSFNVYASPVGRCKHHQAERRRVGAKSGRHSHQVTIAALPEQRRVHLRKNFVHVGMSK